MAKQKKSEISGNSLHHEITQDHAQQLSDMRAAQGDLSAGQARTAAQITGIEQQLKTGLASLQSAIHENRRPPQQIWPMLAVVGTGCAVLVAVFGSFATGMQRENDLRFQFISEYVASEFAERKTANT